MADIWANSVACHPRAKYHIAGCCHLVNSLSRFQSHMPHCIGVRIPSVILKIVFRHILFYFCFYCSLGFDERWRSYRLRYTCLYRDSERRLYVSMLSVCSFVCPFVCRHDPYTKRRISQKLSKLWSLLTTYRKSYMGFSKNPLLHP